MQTGMYAISEMASLFNVSRQTLIYYDKIGLFKPAVVMNCVPNLGRPK